MEAAMKVDPLDSAEMLLSLHRLLPDIAILTNQDRTVSDSAQIIMDKLIHAVLNDLQVISMQVDLLGPTPMDAPASQLIFRKLEHASHLLRHGRAYFSSSLPQLQPSQPEKRKGRRNVGAKISTHCGATPTASSLRVVRGR
jgi:hypothetical protein